MSDSYEIVGHHVKYPTMITTDDKYSDEMTASLVTNLKYLLAFIVVLFLVKIVYDCL